MAQVTAELYCCSECLQVINYYHGTNLEIEGNLMPGNVEISFSWEPCDVCGSRLGGSRYQIFVLKD